MDLARAVAFVEANGTEQERARLHWLVDAVPPGPAIRESLAALQDAGGGFPLGMTPGRPTSVDSTLTSLWWMEELGQLESPLAGRACAYLRSVQQADGGWDEDPALAHYDLPPWVQVGHLPTRLYLTAYAAYWLGRHDKGHPALRRALDFSRPHQDGTGRFGGYLHTTRIAAGAFPLAGPSQDPASRQGLEALLDLPLGE